MHALSLMKFAFVKLELYRAISVFAVSQNNQLKTINIPKGCFGAVYSASLQSYLKVMYPEPKQCMEVTSTQQGQAVVLDPLSSGPETVSEPSGVK